MSEFELIDEVIYLTVQINLIEGTKDSAVFRVDIRDKKLVQAELTSSSRIINDTTIIKRSLIEFLESKAYIDSISEAESKIFI